MIKVWQSFSIVIVLAMLVFLAPAVVFQGPPVNVALAQEITEELEVTFSFSESSGGAWYSFTAGTGGTPVVLQQYTRQGVNSGSQVAGSGFQEYCLGTGTVGGDLTGSLTVKWNMWRFNMAYPYTPVYYGGASMFGFMFGRMELDCGGGDTVIFPFVCDLGGNVNMTDAAGKGVLSSDYETGVFEGHKIMGSMDMTKTGTSFSGAMHIRDYPPDDIQYQGVTHVEGEVIAETRDRVVESADLVYFNASYGDYHVEDSGYGRAGLEELWWGEEESGGADAKYVISAPIGTGGYVDGSRNSFMDSGRVSLGGEFSGILCQKLRINDTYAQTGNDSSLHGLINQLLMLDMPSQRVRSGGWSLSLGYGITPYGLWEPCTESFEGLETFGRTEVGVQAAISGPYNQRSDTAAWACAAAPKIFDIDPPQGYPKYDYDINISGLYFLKALEVWGGSIDFGDNITVNYWSVANQSPMENMITVNISIEDTNNYGMRDVNVTSCFGIEKPAPNWKSTIVVDGFAVVPEGPGVTVSPKVGLVTTEGGGTDIFTMVLNVAPSAPVSVDLSSSDITEGNVSPTSVTFQTWNWDTPQTVTVTGGDDLVTDGDIGYNIVTSNTSSSQGAYDDLGVDDVSVTNIDDDFPSVVVLPTSGLVTTEAGGSDTYDMKLGVGPVASVIVTLSSDDPGEGTASPSSVTFGTVNWSTWQTVTVTGVDDDVDDNHIAYSITNFPCSSADPAYDGVGVDDVDVTNLDDDEAGITVTPTSGLTTTEGGGTDDFSIVLWSEPTAQVVISADSDDTSEGTASPDEITFGAGNWSTPQVVTVTGQDDSEYDGHIDYNIVTSLSSADPLYSFFDPTDVLVQNEDDERFTLTMAVNGSGTIDPAVGVYDYVPFTGETITAYPNAGHMFIDWSMSNETLDVLAFSETFPVEDSSWDGTGQDNPWSVSTTSTSNIRISDITGAAEPPHLHFQNCDGDWTNDFAYTSIDLSGYSNVDIEYMVRIHGNDNSNEGIRCEYYSGGTWYTMYEYTDDNVAWQLDHFDLPDAHATADFVLRFNAAGSGNDDYSFIDTVTVIGNMGTQWTDTNNPTDVILGSDTGATANFDWIPYYDLDMQLGTGSGTTTPSVGTHNYAGGTNVTLTAFPGANNSFGDWTMPSPLTYRKPVDITGTGTALSDYQIKLAVSHVAGKMNSDFSDLRFKDAGGTPLSYWIEEYFADTSADVWVKVPAIAASGTTTIYMHYGNASLSSESDMVTTFIIGDDFDDNSMDPAWSTMDSDGTVGTSFTETAMRMMIDANGADMFSSGDEFGAVYQSATGDFVATVKVISQENTGSYARSGLVVRNDMSQPGSSTGYSAMAVTPGNGWMFAWDSNNNGYLDDYTTTGSSSYPTYIKMTKVGTTFKGYYSTDGDSWTLVDQATLSSAVSTQDIGMHQTSYSGGELGLAVFDDIMVRAYADPEPASGIGSEEPVGGTQVITDNPTWMVMDSNKTVVANFIGGGPPPGITVTPTSGLVTSEDLGFATFTIVLDSEPSGSVTIDLASSDEGEGTVAPSSVTFTTGDWDDAQTVTVTGEDDGEVDGPIGYTINVGPVSSTDGGYSAIDPDDVSVTNLDNDGDEPILDGQLTFPGNQAGRVMTVSFYDPGTHAEEAWSPKSATTDATGNFTITTGLVAGTYDVSVKNHTCLSEVELGIVLVDGTTTYVNFGSSREGDSDGNNGINIADISILIAAYGTTPGDGDWNANCDYNRDSGVSIADISILIANYGDSGDPYP